MYRFDRPDFPVSEEISIFEEDVAHFLAPEGGMDALQTIVTLPLHAEEAPELQMLKFIGDLHRIRAEREHALAELQHAQHDALMRLIRATEFKDGETGAHVQRIGALSALVAFAAGQDEAWCKLIEHAAPMHDVGKIGIPDAILKKAGKLSDEEWLIMRQHPLIGAHILGGSTAPLMQMAAEIALHHHERWDGSGYPTGLRGTDIPLSGRIVAIVDFIDALTMDRPYRNAIPDDEAFAMLQAGAGELFDPRLVEITVEIRSRLLACRDAINALSAQG
jgi:putative two-component system response regulator